MIKAKPIVKDQFWILKKGDKKVGEVNSSELGFRLNVGEHTTHIKTISNLREKFGIEMDLTINPTIQNVTHTDVHGYPAKGEIFNPIWDVQNKIPLYTQKENSKSLFAAGWYRVNIHNKEKIVFSPKLIILQRNPYEGPFKEDPSKNEFTHLFE